jgi:hypothetical protein
MPTIRFEGHYFYRLLKGDEQKRAVKLGLANLKVGGVKNPKTQEARYLLLDKAKAINLEAAIMSTSYGVGQVMGSHWKSLGFLSAADFEKSMTGSFESQVVIMAKFIIKNGLRDEANDKDWAGYARGYNGPLYRKNNYDQKIAALYLKAKNGQVGRNEVHKPDGMLRMGSSGARVRELQTLLIRAGYAVNADGDFGPATKRAVMDFQEKQSSGAYKV